MRKTEAIVYFGQGPHLAARKMRQLGLSTAFVVDQDRKFRGYITIDDVLQLEKKASEAPEGRSKQTVAPILRDDAYVIAPDAQIADLIVEASTNALPFPVVGEDGKLQGIVTRPAILAGIAGD